MNNKFSPLKLASSADDLQSNIVHSECLFQQTNQICSQTRIETEFIIHGEHARTQGIATQPVLIAMRVQ